MLCSKLVLLRTWVCKVWSPYHNHNKHTAYAPAKVSIEAIKCVFVGKKKSVYSIEWERLDCWKVFLCSYAGSSMSENILKFLWEDYQIEDLSRAFSLSLIEWIPGVLITWTLERKSSGIIASRFFKRGRFLRKCENVIS